MTTPVRHALVASAHKPDTLDLANELRRLGCVVACLNPGEPIAASLLKPMDFAVVGSRFAAADTYSFEMTVRRSSIPVICLPPTGHAKKPLTLQEGRVITCPAGTPVADLLDLLEGLVRVDDTCSVESLHLC